MNNPTVPYPDLVRSATPVAATDGAWVSVLTAGRDKPYAFGLATALAASAVKLDFICGDELDIPELRNHSNIKLLNLRRDQRENTGLWEKAVRIVAYYRRLLLYAVTARTRIFHILWNNKFELFDRTLLMAYYRLFGKKIVFTAHNINAGRRDASDSWLNRFSLKLQYRLSDHIFVHTEKMKSELAAEFQVPERKISVIPLGVNNSVPDTGLTRLAARQTLGLGAEEKVILFFGRIAPYKGLTFLLEAFESMAATDKNLRLVVAGQPKGAEAHWQNLLAQIQRSSVRSQMILKIEFVPDEATEIYFKAADVLALPYTHIFQSGVLILAQTFGLPVIVARVGSLAEDVIEGETGLVVEPENAPALAAALQTYFSSPLYRELPARRPVIQKLVRERNSWDRVAADTVAVYSRLLVAREA